MKLSVIEEIATTCSEFTDQVLCPQESATYETLMERVKDVCNFWLEREDKIFIDYKNMTFTAIKDNVLGRWHLDNNARYNNKTISEPIELED